MGEADRHTAQNKPEDKLIRGLWVGSRPSSDARDRSILLLYINDAYSETIVKREYPTMVIGTQTASVRQTDTRTDKQAEQAHFKLLSVRPEAQGKQMDKTIKTADL